MLMGKHFQQRSHCCKDPSPWTTLGAAILERKCGGQHNKENSKRLGWMDRQNPTRSLVFILGLSSGPELSLYSWAVF